MRRLSTIIVSLIFNIFTIKVAHASDVSELRGIVNNYKQFDINGDGVNEINNLEMYYSAELNLDDSSNMYETTFKLKENNLRYSENMVIVLVEKRLFDNERTSFLDYDLYNLKKRLDHLREDLQREGKDAHFILTDLYKGEIHQDGRIVLALRRMFQDIFSASNKKFKGAVLIGSFPETQIIHRYAWRKEAEHTINSVETSGRHWLRIVPEVRAANSDLILSDLDGNWENTYIQENTDVSYFKGIPSPSNGKNWHQSNQRVLFSITEEGTKNFEDFFFVDDATFQKRRLTLFQRITNRLSILRGHRPINLIYNTFHSNPELTDDDKLQPNKIARPEILVSRINPKQIALTPIEDFGGDTLGNPIEFTNQSWVRMVQNKDLERKLLIEYLDYNHKFRNGGFRHTPFRGGVISSENFNISSRVDYVNSAHPDLETAVVAPSHANIIDYVNFLKTPARLRMITAHSSGHSSGFKFRETDFSMFPEPFRRQMEENLLNQRTQNLEEVVGDQIYSWWNDQKRGLFTPSLKNQAKGTADFYLMKSIYHSQTLEDVPPSFIVHSGCNFMTQPRFNDRPYHSVNYGRLQNSNSLLFYGKALTIIGRSKVFNDTALFEGGLNDMFALSNEYGNILKEYFRRDSQNAEYAQKVAANKRTYSWSIIGDWTLFLRYRETNNANYTVGETFIEPADEEEDSTPSYRIVDNSSSFEVQPLTCHDDDIDLLFEQAGDEDPFSCVKNYCESPEVLADLYPHDLTPEQVYDWWMEDGRYYYGITDQNGNYDNNRLSDLISGMSGLGGDCLQYYCQNDALCMLRYIRFEGNLNLAKAQSNSCLGNYLTCIEATGESFLLTDLLEPQDSISSPVNEYIRHHQRRISSCVERYNSCNSRTQSRFHQSLGGRSSRSERSREAFTPRF